MAFCRGKPREPKESLQASASNLILIGTKKVRVVCTDCNNGWMSEIVERAKPVALRLINNEKVEIDESAQRALTDWIALSALMANQITKSQHRLPKSDVTYFYQNHSAPTHWFVGIGHFEGLRGIAFNHSPFALWEQDTNTGQRLVGFIKQAFASVMGSLYTIVDVEVNLSGAFPLPIGKTLASQVYAPSV